MAALAAVPVRAELAPTPCADAGVRLYAVRVDCAGGRPVTGWLTVPADASPTNRYPAEVSYRGASKADQPAPAKGPHDRIRFESNGHGFDLGRGPDYVKAFFDSVRRPGFEYGFDPESNEHRETSYWLGMALRAVRALEWIVTLPEWDGRTLSLAAGSQGGWQALMAAARFPRVTRVSTSVTWGCDWTGQAEFGRLPSTYRPACWFPDMAYFDAVFAARRVACPVEISKAGLGDYVSPPSSLAVLYNELRGPKKIVWHQGWTHGWQPDAIAERIAALCPESDLHFYDAVAPIVTLESVDMDSAFFASRYDKGTADYVNCPMDKEEYLAFVTELVSAKEAEVHGFDDGGVFEGCMPVEVMARRGVDTLRYGPLKPVGLRDPRTGKENYAVVQLRRDNADGTLYNLVGFQTHLTWGEQKRVFSMIPALKNAEFVRYGVMHRNTYLNSPQLLDRYYRLRSEPRISFAGQMTGVEGYVESAASGMLVGIETAARVLGLPPVDFPQETAIGALGLYISGGSVGDFPAHEHQFRHHQPSGLSGQGQEKQERRDLPPLAGDPREAAGEGGFSHVKIIVDAMGGDNAPLEIVKGALRARKELGVELILVGRKEAIRSLLQEKEAELPASRSWTPAR